MITHVAIRYRDIVYSLPKPNRHNDVIRLIFEEIGEAPPEVYGENQGFLDDQGRYLTRRQALFVAQKAEQLLPDTKIVHKMLFSENVW